MSICQETNFKKLNYQELFNCLVTECSCDSCVFTQLKFRSFKIIRNFIRKNLKKEKVNSSSFKNIEDSDSVCRPQWLTRYYHNLLDKTIYLNSYNIKHW